MFSKVFNSSKLTWPFESKIVRKTAELSALSKSPNRPCRFQPHRSLLGTKMIGEAFELARSEAHFGDQQTTTNSEQYWIEERDPAWRSHVTTGWMRMESMGIRREGSLLPDSTDSGGWVREGGWNPPSRIQHTNLEERKICVLYDNEQQTSSRNLIWGRAKRWRISVEWRCLLFHLLLFCPGDWGDLIADRGAIWASWESRRKAHF